MTMKSINELQALLGMKMLEKGPPGPIDILRYSMGVVVAIGEMREHWETWQLESSAAPFGPGDDAGPDSQKSTEERIWIRASIGNAVVAMMNLCTCRGWSLRTILQEFEGMPKRDDQHISVAVGKLCWDVMEDMDSTDVERPAFTKTIWADIGQICYFLSGFTDDCGWDDFHMVIQEAVERAIA